MPSNPPTLPVPRPAPPAGAETAIEGTVARIVFRNEENGWSVVRLEVPGRGETTAVGPLLGLQAGEQVRLSGRWVQDPTWGEQFRAESYLTVEPTTARGIERYLGSGMVPGIGKKIAQRLVRHFGKEALDVIDHHPERLREVPGIGAVLSKRILEAWQGQRAIRDVMVFLQGHGVGTGHAVKIWKTYEQDAVRTVRENPFALAEDVHGIGFPTADRIARDVGLAADAPQRLAAGLLHALRQAADQGHVFVPEERLLAGAAALLEVDESALGEPLAGLEAAGRVIVEQPDAKNRDVPAAVFLTHLARAEEELAKRLRALANRPAPPLRIDVERALAWYQKQAGVALAPEQREALARAIAGKALVITGGPGTGKTTLVRGIVAVLRKKGLKVKLAAPTGRAAKRLAEATEQAASTVHRLLEYNPRSHGFERHDERPLAADVLVVDEASMLDTALARDILRAVPDRARLILVGDVDQLPSVGPGRVLADIIDSGAVDVVRLQKVFRQAQQSLIVTNAHRVRAGSLPILRPPEDRGDFFFFRRDAPDAIRDTLLELVVERLPRRFGFDPTRDIQVLSPMQRGPLGAISLNAELQARLNPEGPSISRGSRLLRVGDRVMQLRNNYDLDVFNGDIGRILGIDREKRRLLVEIDERTVVYDFAHLDQLTLAYAGSIHKAQGSEYPCVVIPLHTQHYVMLQRNLLYTAITRGRKLVVVVGSPRALRRAVDNVDADRRNTRLAQRLAG